MVAQRKESPVHFVAETSLNCVHNRLQSFIYLLDGHPGIIVCSTVTSPEQIGIIVRVECLDLVECVLQSPEWNVAGVVFVRFSPPVTSLNAA